MSVVDTYTSSWRSSCDDCSTKNVRVQTTYMYYELAIYSFVGSHRYLSLWPIKGSETYAMEEDAMIIHVIKKKTGLSHRNVKEMSNRTHTKPYKCWNSLHVGRKLTKDRTCIIILRTRNATRCSWTIFFSHGKRRWHNTNYRRHAQCWTASVQLNDICSRLILTQEFKTVWNSQHCLATDCTGFYSSPTRHLKSCGEF